MTEKNTEFKAANLEAWARAAAKSAPGGNVEALNWITPDGIAVKYLLGTLYEEKGEKSKAVAEYQSIVQEGKRFAPAYMNLVDLDVKDGKMDQALVVLAAGLRAGLEDESFYGDMDRRIGEAATVPDIANRFKLAVEPKDQDYAFYYVLGRIEQELKKNPEAIAAYKEVLRLKPDFTHCTIRLASVYVADNKSAEAAAVLKAAADKDPSSLLLWRFLADADLAAGKTADAVDAMKHVVSLDPSNDANVRLLIALMSKAGQNDEAEKFLEEGLRDHPDDSDRWSLLLGSFYIEHDMKLDRAVDVLKDAIEDTPDNPQLMAALAQAYLKLRQFDKAVDLLQAAKELDATDMAIQVDLALALEQDKKVDDAERAFRDALKSKPDSPGLMAELGRFLIRTKRGPDEGVALLQRAVAVDKDNEAYKLALAWAYVQLKRHGEAIQILTDMLKEEPDSSSARYQLAMVYDDMKDFPKAEAELKKVLKNDPSDAEASNALGYMYAEKSINLDEAQKLVAAALAQEPENGAYLDSMGWVFFRKGDLPKAVDYLKKAFDHEKDAVLAEHLGDAYSKMGQKDSAMKCYEQAAALDPENKTAAKKIDLLKAGKDPLTVNQ